LDWKEYPVTSAGYLEGFDFSARALERRIRSVAPRQLLVFDISRSGTGLKLALADKVEHLQSGVLSLLHQHLLLKMILNIHSTLVMGRMGRYESNLMTWVRPSNNKLIDRAARYVLLLLERDGVTCSYEQVIRRLFTVIDELSSGIAGSLTDHPIVLETYRSIRQSDKV
jgi:N-acetylmuramic acid 6-phosphate etherase